MPVDVVARSVALLSLAVTIINTAIGIFLFARGFFISRITIVDEPDEALVIYIRTVGSPSSILKIKMQLLDSSGVEMVGHIHNEDIPLNYFYTREYRIEVKMSELKKKIHNNSKFVISNRRFRVYLECEFLDGSILKSFIREIET